MQSKNRIFDDMAKVASGAVSTFSGVREEIDGMIRQQIERVMADMDVVPRDEFEAVKAMAAKARAEQDALIARIDELEAALKKSKK
ncbi:accessory factor UbiK family protein [Terasakiella sp. A23]|uniref:accessory factor UbiK family protein n=1 Tax=Terasakiella sp. FCG-A23 TaxID=3080561 RepID=UPI002953B52F|nr:accessory factor UbiK family protein [Terasakiella sp. A23]MDV7338049.1 accessory factor UbiK family protein [Terasakiella sp. A23]